MERRGRLDPEVRIDQLGRSPPTLATFFERALRPRCPGEEGSTFRRSGDARCSLMIEVSSPQRSKTSLCGLRLGRDTAERVG